jgi:hypothetical protein
MPRPYCKFGCCQTAEVALSVPARGCRPCSPAQIHAYPPNIPAFFLLQLCWRPSQDSQPSFLVVTAAGALLAGSPAGAALAPLASAPGGSIACAAWSASGRQLAVGRGAEVVLCGPDGAERFSVQAASQDLEDETTQQLKASGPLDNHLVLDDTLGALHE